LLCVEVAFCRVCFLRGGHGGIRKHPLR